MKPGQENLIPITERSPDEAREMGRKGGKASGAARRKKRDAKKLARHLLEMGITGGAVTDIEELQSLAEISGQNITALDAIILKQIQVAMSGDLKAARFLVELLEEGDKAPAARREQKARIDKMRAETKKVEEETARKYGEEGVMASLDQSQAIADLINSPQADRVLEDYLNPKGEEPDQVEEEKTE